MKDEGPGDAEDREGRARHRSLSERDSNRSYCLKPGVHATRNEAEKDQITKGLEDQREEFILSP